MQLGICPSELLLCLTEKTKQNKTHSHFAHWKNKGKDENGDIRAGSKPAHFGQVSYNLEILYEKEIRCCSSLYQIVCHFKK